MVKIFGVT